MEITIINFIYEHDLSIDQYRSQIGFEVFGSWFRFVVGWLYEQTLVINLLLNSIYDAIFSNNLVLYVGLQSVELTFSERKWCL